MNLQSPAGLPHQPRPRVSPRRRDNHAQLEKPDDREDLDLNPELRVDTLSSGLSKRVALGRAMAATTDVLLLREPANHLDLNAFDWPAGLKEEQHRDAAPLTFVVTLSGRAVAGTGSALWGVVAGGVALAEQRRQ